MLRAYPGLSGADLARVALLTPQTVGVIIGNLERDGAIRKTAHPVHGRVLQWTLTRRGEALLAKCRRHAQTVERRLGGRPFRAGAGRRCGAGCPKSPQICRNSWFPRRLGFWCPAVRAAKLAPMKQPDSLISPTRRALLQAGLGATALLANPLAALAPPRPASTSGATIFAPARWQRAFRMRPTPA